MVTFYKRSVFYPGGELRLFAYAAYGFDAYEGGLCGEKDYGFVADGGMPAGIFVRRSHGGKSG